MKKLTAALFVGIVLLALAAIAFGAGDSRITADGGMNLTGYTSIELLADGNVTVGFYNIAADSLIRTRYVRDSIPRMETWSFYSSIDSVYFDLDGATEVIANPK